MLTLCKGWKFHSAYTPGIKNEQSLTYLLTHVSIRPTNPFVRLYECDDIKKIQNTNYRIMYPAKVPRKAVNAKIVGIHNVQKKKDWHGGCKLTFDWNCFRQCYFLEIFRNYITSIISSTYSKAFLCCKNKLSQHLLYFLYINRVSSISSPKPGVNQSLINRFLNEKRQEKTVKCNRNNILTLLGQIKG